MKKALFILFFASLPLHSMAQESSAPAGEPTVTIRHGEQETFYDYRVNGILVEIKVVPKQGPVYYLVPAEGGGWIRQEESQLLIPSWKILTW